MSEWTERDVSRGAENLRADMPDVEWDTPIEFPLPSGDTIYVCRYCLAYALIGPGAEPELWHAPEEAEAHIRETHGGGER